MRKHPILIPLILVISIAVMTVDITSTTAHPQTTISPSPKDSTIVAPMGEEFTVNITVSNVENLNLYQVGLTFNQSILEATSYEAGDFFLQAPEEYRTATINQPVLADGFGFLGKWIHVTWWLKSPGAVSGTGTLAVVTFKVVALGFSRLDIIMSESRAALLGNVNRELIPFSAINGSVTVASGYYIDHSVVLEGETFHVSTFSNSSISDFGVSPLEKKINFTATGTGTGFCNITIPKNFLSASQEDWKITIDGKNPLIASSISESSTHTMIYLVYSHSGTVTIEIIGTWMVHTRTEFPTIMLLLLFIIASLIVVILVKLIKRKKPLASKTGPPTAA